MAYKVDWLLQDRIFVYHCYGETGAADIAEVMPLYVAAIQEKTDKVHLLIDFSEVEQINMSLFEARKIPFEGIKPQQGHIVFILQRGHKFYSVLHFLSRTIMKMFPIPFHVVDSLPAALTILQSYDPGLETGSNLASPPSAE
jgi:hypothetical protein